MKDAMHYALMIKHDSMTNSKPSVGLDGKWVTTLLSQSLGFHECEMKGHSQSKRHKGPGHVTRLR